MKIIINPSTDQYQNLCRRESLNKELTEQAVRQIVEDVKLNGDSALVRLTSQFDRVKIDSLYVSQEFIDDSEKYVSDRLKIAINSAIRNVTKFHSFQKRETVDVIVGKGIECSIKYLPIERVGIYIPGGSAPLFSSVIMLAVPALIAGCKDIILFTPPTVDGEISREIAYTSKVLGISNIVKVGGAQAIAAMAYGTESIKSVDKIFGPGNMFVNCAKELVCKDVSVDMFAGPSELLVIADDSANPTYVASDLLSQAEHGIDSQITLLSDSLEFIESVVLQLDVLTKGLNRAEIIIQSLKSAKAILFESIILAIDYANIYAPEHLIISTKGGDEDALKIKNCGSLFIGPFSTESAGDYASGTNHTLPTSGWSKSVSGVTVDSFTKSMTIQKLTKEGLESISQDIIEMANAEGLDAHALAIKARVINNFN